MLKMSNVFFKTSTELLDHLFLSYAETFKQFPPRRLAILKVELAALFARAEINALDAQTTPASLPHYSANSTGSCLTTRLMRHRTLRS